MQTIPTLILLATMLFATHVCGHNLQLEPQMVEPGSDPLAVAAEPWNNLAGDTTFDSPMPLGWTIGTSQIVFGYLDANDVDYYTFTISHDNLTTAPIETNDYEQASRLFNAANPVLIAAALPPACAETLDNYPAVALIAKIGTAKGLFSYIDVPFEVPEGYETFAMTNAPPAPGGQRVIFNIPAEDGEEPLNLSWFLPKGCKMPDPNDIMTLDCSKSRSLVGSILAEGETYYVAVWDPKGTAQDYSLNIGIDEMYFSEDPEIEDAVRDNKYLHTSCSPPYASPSATSKTCYKPQACSMKTMKVPERFRK